MVFFHQETIYDPVVEDPGEEEEEYESVSGDSVHSGD